MWLSESSVAGVRGGRYTEGMDTGELAYVGAWFVNLVLAGIFNLRELGHAAGELLVFGAIFFLVAAPLHVMLVLYTWSRRRAELELRVERGAAQRAATSVICAESLLFWTAYWGMILGYVPLHIQL